MDNLTAAQSGDVRTALEVLRDTLAERIDTTDKDVHAQLAAQYRATLEAIAALEGLGVAIVSSWLVRDDVADGALQTVLPAWRAAPAPRTPGRWSASMTPCRASTSAAAPPARRSAAASGNCWRWPAPC